MSILCLTTSGLLTEHGYRKSNPHTEMQTARVSRLNNEALLRASVPRPRQSRRTNCQGIFLRPDTASDTGLEKRQVNPLKGAHKGYFQTLSMNSRLVLNHRQSLPLVLKDSQIRGQRWLLNATALIRQVRWINPAIGASTQRQPNA